MIYRAGSRKRKTGRRKGTRERKNKGRGEEIIGKEKGEDGEEEIQCQTLFAFSNLLEFDLLEYLEATKMDACQFEYKRSTYR